MIISTRRATGVGFHTVLLITLKNDILHSTWKIKGE